MATCSVGRTNARWATILYPTIVMARQIRASWTSKPLSAQAVCLRCNGRLGRRARQGPAASFHYLATSSGKGNSYLLSTPGRSAVPSTVSDGGRCGDPGLVQRFQIPTQWRDTTRDEASAHLSRVHNSDNWFPHFSSHQPQAPISTQSNVENKISPPLLPIKLEIPLTHKANPGKRDHSLFLSHQAQAHIDGTMPNCRRCRDTGYYKDKETCSDCRGAGSKSTTETCGRCLGNGSYYENEDCRYCSGKGKVWLPQMKKWETCSGCRGAKKVEAKKSCGPCGGTGKKTKSVKCTGCNGKGSKEVDKKCTH
ncbi:hypothetical protein GE09DRAFT_344486 [Coniochaeta sp. 2T2.1]|nr:hypothetical protein GE09DRAFT_344486 [Coniochaeta sp. 2T2.1]